MVNNMKKSFLFLMVLTIVVGSSAGKAQRVGRGRVTSRRAGRAFVGYRAVTSPYRFGAYPYGAYGNFSSTAMEGAQRGMADMLRARGQAEESRAKAMIDYEEARSKYIDNKAKWTKTKLERQRMAQAARQEHYAKKRATREKYLAAKRTSTTTRLSPSQLDPTSGKVYWPDALKDDKYAGQRNELDELFVLRAHIGTTPDLSSRVHETARKMQSKLKGDIRKIPAHEYIAARKFLDGLAREARTPTG
jgi:hypothetical protein